MQFNQEVNINNERVIEIISKELRNKVSVSDINIILKMKGINSRLRREIIDYFKIIYKISLIKEGISKVTASSSILPRIGSFLRRNKTREKYKIPAEENTDPIMPVEQQERKHPSDNFTLPEGLNKKPVLPPILPGARVNERTSEKSQDSVLTPEQARLAKILGEGKKPMYFKEKKNEAGNPTRGGMKPKKKNMKNL